MRTYKLKNQYVTLGIVTKILFNVFGVTYVILMLHSYVTLLRGQTCLILWHIYSSIRKLCRQNPLGESRFHSYPKVYSNNILKKMFVLLYILYKKKHKLYISFDSYSNFIDKHLKLAGYLD